ncbi:hypothetical protein EFM16_17495, partial [Lactiplantibacillus plantarum]|nr:hypothetical protein [Lactiplantibacillus plantarum]
QSNFNHVTINEIIAALEPINQRPLKTIGLIRINFTIYHIDTIFNLFRLVSFTIYNKEVSNASFSVNIIHTIQ